MSPEDRPADEVGSDAALSVPFAFTTNLLDPDPAPEVATNSASDEVARFVCNRKP